MSDTKDRPVDLTSSEELDRDIDLDMDMDAPLGSTFAAALRTEDHADELDDSDGSLLDELGAEFGDDGLSLRDGPDMQAEGSPFDDVTAAEPEADDGFGLSADDAPPMEAAASAQSIRDLAKSASDAPPLQADDDGSYLPNPSGGDRALPRISLHAFSARSEFNSMMRNISEDRRMNNVTLEVHEGGVPAAIKYYGNETTPNLLVLEFDGDPQQVLDDLDALAEHCDENIRVIVIGDTNDIKFYRELMNRGISEYLVTPVHPVQLIRSASSLFSNPETPFVGKTIAVTGVKGGVGASVIAHNLAWALSERVKVNTSLVDLDLNFGTTGLDFNQETAATIADALMSPDRFDDAVMGRLIAKASERLSLFTAPATLDRTYDLDPEVYVQVLEQVRTSVPYVVLDLPHIWSDWFKSTVMSSDEIIIVATPDLTGLRNGKNLIDFLKAARPNDAPPKLVLNMVGLPKRPEIPAKDFGPAIGMEPTAVIPFDAVLFGTASNNGQMIFDVAKDTKCTQPIDDLAALLSGQEIEAQKPSLMKKILGG